MERGVMAARVLSGFPWEAVAEAEAEAEAPAPMEPSEAMAQITVAVAVAVAVAMRVTAQVAMGLKELSSFDICRIFKRKLCRTRIPGAGPASSTP
ncbi:MAG: hypothetical protein C5B49_08110 [Bdellovibrio sp.]|nr:MAG: hypothetical protein C5B49_08110 [Bdellovibrio sp.]